MIQRPQTLQAAAAESESYEDFGHNLKDFLHAFAEASYMQPEKICRRSFLDVV